MYCFEYSYVKFVMPERLPVDINTGWHGCAESLHLVLVWVLIIIALPASSAEVAAASVAVGYYLAFS